MSQSRLAQVEHPGTVIKVELDARGWSQRDLAFVLGMQEPQLNRILTGKGAITADMARALGDALDIEAEFFSNLQSQFELSMARDPDPDVKRRATLQTAFPLRDMIKRGWIEETDAALLEMQVAKFFEVPTYGTAPQIAHAARKSDYSDIPPAQLAWLFRVRQLAHGSSVGEYSAESLTRLLPKLAASTIDPEAVQSVGNSLAKCGVRFVIVEQLPSAKIDGACFWIGNSPVIGMSLRFDRLDNFWFVLRHEIEHVLRGDGKDVAIVDDLEGDKSSVTSAQNEAERAANSAASTFVVPAAKLESFIARKGQFISEKDVVGFAGVLGTHPAIVVGQLHHKTGKYSLFRKYLVPVRKYLVESEASRGMLDGWGALPTVRTLGG